MDIAGLNLSQDHLWQIAAGSFGLALFLITIRHFLIKRQLFRLCGVPTSSHRLMGTTSFWFGRPVKLNRNNLQGIPSSVFLKKDGKSAYVCHMNPRPFKGRLKVRERYQMIIFMGLVKEIYNPEKIQGAILFQDHFEPVKYDADTYQQLLDMRDEYSIALEDWKSPNVQPLYNR